MSEPSVDRFHKIYGERRPRIIYNRRDFIDYAVMASVVSLLVYAVYGRTHVLTAIGVLLSVFMVAAFIVRHGAGIAVPKLARRPQELIYLLIYKIENIKPMYLVAVLIVLLENLAIDLTPTFPHHHELMRKIGLWLFYLHFGTISVYRTAILVSHLKNHKTVDEVLRQTSWKNFISKQKSIKFEILHAYFTGILTHIVLIAPWYLAITHLKFSILFMPAVVAMNLFVQFRFLKSLNEWYYRDHWLGHNSEMEFLYLHGSHHDAIPSGLIGVAGNGFLEGFTRNTLGYPTPFFNPIAAFLSYTFDVFADIRSHQYIPGVYPRLRREFHEVTQHSTHHFGRLAPYGFAIKLDVPDASDDIKKEFGVLPQELQSAVELDEKLTGFQWNNARYRRFLELFDKYQKESV